MILTPTTKKTVIILHISYYKTISEDYSLLTGITPQLSGEAKNSVFLVCSKENIIHIMSCAQ